MKKVIIIDDEMNIRSALTRELHDYGYGVIIASTGLEALSKLRTQNVDLIILDLKMPVMDGFEFLKNVIITEPQIKIVILSGNITKQNLTDLVNYKKNIIGILVKPWDSDQLIKILEKCFSEDTENREKRGRS